jgi:hypothetical protein
MSDLSSTSAPAPSESSASSGFQLRDLLFFEKMIVPSLVKVAYYLGCAIAIVVGVVAIINGASSRMGGGLQVVSGLMTVIVGPLLIRIVCEQVIVLFGIYDRLGEIRDQNEKT